MNDGMLTLSNARRSGAAGMLLAAALMLAACASAPNRAPVEDRSPARAPVTTATPTLTPSPGAMPALPAGESGKVLPGAENAGKPGYYSVKPGDTMIRIGLETGQNWKDLVKWNNLDNPNVIEVGQVLRVVPPGNDAGVSTRPVALSRVETRPLDAKPAAVAGNGAAPAATPAPAAPTPAPAPPAAREGDDDINWLWPAAGSIASVFEEGKSKGLAIAGKPGDPVLAAADGRVVYAGSGLRGYGNLVILKHNTTYLTAYAHNQSLLVKEDQSVRRGQKIAEMGSSDAERVMLHFEIRKQGKPVDPAKLLPPR
jgi:lipoprotein NlpD